MKRFLHFSKVLLVFALLSLFLLLVLPVPQARASSQQAYKDYLYQYDIYRTAYTQFKIAKTEYEKFRSLASQTTALEKTKTMMAQRDQLLRAYLLVLNEKLNEDTGLNPADRVLYQTLIRNEVAFLEKHSALIPAVSSLADAESVSDQLESHYKILQTSMHQILTGIAVGQLATLHQQFDVTMGLAQTVVATYGYQYDPQKQSLLNRWLLQITNKRTLYQQNVDSVVETNAQLQTTDERELDRQYNELLQGLARARQYLAEGASFMQELVTILRYKQ